ncbi:MAG: DUF3788 family protein [Tenuifilaceae bacterium]|jgi:hypothetical protein|nr:DUF3788 family protein [Tenuifilaceae bacterium]
MAQQLLRDADIPPTPEVISQSLGNNYAVYSELINRVTSPEFGLTTTWNFYKDGKSWLCKVEYKRKTVFWLSVWEQMFMLSFYFTEKTSSGIDTLDIDGDIKQRFALGKAIGKLIPLTFEVVCMEQLADILKVIRYKQSLK